VPRLLPPAVDQAAYRILQESLTNAARHGDGGAELGLAYGDRDLELTVSNPAAAAGPLDGGHGVLGMRERAALLHGSLHVESSGGRFTVRARLPYAGGT
jgi:signal transduction histidine kinase